MTESTTITSDAYAVPGSAHRSVVPPAAVDADPGRLQTSFLTRPQPHDFSAYPPSRAVDVTAPHPPAAPTRLRSQSYCMQSSIVGQSLDRTRVVIIPLPCKSWDCPICGPRKRASWIRRLAAGKPTREITLTCPAGKFPDAVSAAVAMKAAFTQLVKRIRKVYKTFEYALVWELTKKDVPHIHLLYKGTYIAQKWLSHAWDKLGIGPIVHIQSIGRRGVHAAHACKYLAKANGQSAIALAPLRIVQISGKYSPEEPEEKIESKYPDFVWTWDKRRQSAILQTFCDHEYYLQHVTEPDGSVIIDLVEHEIPDYVLDLPEWWVAFPDSQPIPDIDRPW